MKIGIEWIGTAIQNGVKVLAILNDRLSAGLDASQYVGKVVV